MEDLILDRKKVKSKKIESIAYNRESFTMEIEFKNGDIFRYFGIPDYIFENFLNSPEKDLFYSKYINHAGFSYEIVN